MIIDGKDQVEKKVEKVEKKEEVDPFAEAEVSE